MTYARRVHVAPVGSDVDRVVEPALQMRADVVYLLEDDHPEAPTADAAVDRLSATGVETHVKEVDHEDVYAVLGFVTTIAHRQAPDDTVMVNVSTGGRLAAVGAALGCMAEDPDEDDDYPTVEGYYAPADVADRPAADGGDLTTVAEDDGTDELPVVPPYHVESPTRDQVAVLAIVVTGDDDLSTPDKRTIIETAVAVNDRLVAGGGDPIEFAASVADTVDGETTAFERFDTSAKKGAYRTLANRALGALEARGYVDVDTERVGRSDPVTVTPAGEGALRAFRHKIIDVIGELDARNAPDWLTDGIGPDG